MGTRHVKELQHQARWIADMVDVGIVVLPLDTQTLCALETPVLSLSPSGRMLVHWADKCVFIQEEAWMRLNDPQRTYFGELLHEIAHAAFPDPPNWCYEIGALMGIEVLMHRLARTSQKFMRWTQTHHLNEDILTKLGLPAYPLGRDLGEMTTRERKWYLDWCVEQLDAQYKVTNLRQLADLEPKPPARLARINQALCNEFREKEPA